MVNNILSTSLLIVPSIIRFNEYTLIIQDRFLENFIMIGTNIPLNLKILKRNETKCLNLMV